MKHPIFHLFWNYCVKTVGFSIPKSLWISIKCEFWYRQDLKQLKKSAEIYDKFRAVQEDHIENFKGKYVTMKLPRIKK